MSVKPLVMGNWKMQGSKSFANDLLKALVAQPILSVDMAVLVPHPYLFLAEDLLQGSDIAWGAQNMHDQEAGAYTGEVSAAMLKDFSARYVLVGHSERRHGLGEGDDWLALKYQSAIEAGITPVLCVGETLEERENNQAESVIERQLSAVFAQHPKWIENVIVAYEPVWAIGTGRSASVEQVGAMHQFIYQRLEKWAPSLAPSSKILYGGSVKPSNAANLLAVPCVNGALIGGASLSAESFLEIAKLCTPSSF